MSWFYCFVLGQFTRNYTQTEKRAADNKRRYAPEEGSIPPVLLSGVSKGACPVAHDFAEQSVVCYTCWRGWRGKRGAVLLAPRLLRQENRLNFCEWEWAKNRAVFRERRQVYESPRPSSYAPTCGQSVPKLWPHSRKSSRTAGNRQGWNERGYTRPWPPPAAPLDGWTRRPIPQSACPRSFWFWGIQFFKIE